MKIDKRQLKKTLKKAQKEQNITDLSNEVGITLKGTNLKRSKSYTLSESQAFEINRILKDSAKEIENMLMNSNDFDFLDDIANFKI